MLNPQGNTGKVVMTIPLFVVRISRLQMILLVGTCTRWDTDVSLTLYLVLYQASDHKRQLRHQLLPQAQPLHLAAQQFQTHLYLQRRGEVQLLGS